MTFGREAGEDAIQAILSRYLEAGGNCVDTANGYGERPRLRRLRLPSTGC